MPSHLRSAVLALGLAVAVATCGTPAEPGSTVVGVLVSPGSASLDALGKSATFSATALDQNGDIVSGVTVTWSSSASGVATVSSSGVVTAVGNGSASISAVVGTASGSASVTVAQVATHLAVTPATLTLAAFGATGALSAEVQDANDNAMAGSLVTWSSSDNGVASVSGTGTVTAESNGTATVTASSTGLSGTAAVTVAQEVTSVTVSDAAPNFDALGDFADITASAEDANGNAVDGLTFTWTSSNSGVAEVVAGTGLPNETVRVRATGNGTATITGDAGGSVTAMIDVSVQQVATQVRVEFSKGVLNKVGETSQATPYLQDANFNDMPGGNWTWFSTNSNIASVNGSGLVSARFNGTVVIQATDQNTGLYNSGGQVTVFLRLSPGEVVPGTIPQSNWEQEWFLNATGMSNFVMWAYPTPYNTFGAGLSSWVQTCYPGLEAFDVQTGTYKTGDLRAVSPFQRCAEQATVKIRAPVGETGDYTLGLSNCYDIQWGVNFGADLLSSDCLIYNGADGSGNPYMTNAVLVHVNNLQAGTSYTVDYMRDGGGSGGNLDAFIYAYGPAKSFTDDFWWDDQGGAVGNDAQVTFTPTVTGTYTFVLTTYRPGQAGFFWFVINPTPAPGGAAAALSVEGLPILLRGDQIVTPPATTLEQLRALGITPASGADRRP
ncbi:MAG TPA: Ig-like domain-containing protein [Gemmatimonadales bacterium]